MVKLDWAVFAGLPGAVEDNFESLCRAIVRRHYARYGVFASLAAQPGIEFHINLQEECSLGEAGRWFGWQCRWYDLPSGRAIGITRKAKILKAIRTTEGVLPRLTDWVLWTRRILTKGDQEWFRGIKTKMTLHLWAGDEVQEHLGGPAQSLRATYFGELILTPDLLAEQRERAVAPIRSRWRPETHQTVDAERSVLRLLGESDAFSDVSDAAVRLHAIGKRVAAYGLNAPADLKPELLQLSAAALDVAAFLLNAYALIERGDLDAVVEGAGRWGEPRADSFHALLRWLRSVNHDASLAATNAVSELRSAVVILRGIGESLAERVVAVVSEAGCGKTQLSAQITAARNERPAGVFMHGAWLSATGSIDELARRYVINGIPTPSVDALIAALDAAGRRAKRRLPLVFDGLNEAEDPRVWKAQLALLIEILARYPFVLCVCTIRPAFADAVLPEGVRRLDVQGYGHDVGAAVKRHFDYYRINAIDAELPWDLFSHPLTLQLFCEVTNPTRREEVSADAMPASLTVLFERYLAQCAARIAELSPSVHPYYENDVRLALGEIGKALWEAGGRSLGLDAARARIGDQSRLWHHSLVRALEEDGVLLRVPSDAEGVDHVAVVYDALAGHLIADAIVVQCGGAGIARWLADQGNVASISGSQSERHPMSSDVFDALVGLVPRKLSGRQVWSLVEEPLRSEAIWRAADLERASLDADTVAELRKLIVVRPTGARDLLDRVWQTRGVVGHPLNSTCLDEVLKSMSVADRDLRWTEWVRARHEGILADLERLSLRWRQLPDGSPSTRLRARWVMWTLTSTVRRLRDEATRTLYWFGRHDVEGLFELTLDSLSVNDAYVSERCLAACYGVVMANQCPGPKFASQLGSFLKLLFGRLAGDAPTSPTSHNLARLYVRGIVHLTRRLLDDQLPAQWRGKGELSFAGGVPVEPVGKDSPHYEEVDRALGMDFANYTVGGLFDDRRNYDDGHEAHQAALSHVRGTLWGLGWRKVTLGKVDQAIVFYRGRIERASTERYGKKYGWIGFHSYTGIMEDDGRIDLRGERSAELHVDPSWPGAPKRCPVAVPQWALKTPKDDQRWIRQGSVSIPDELLRCAEIDEAKGPWIAVAADLDTGSRVLGRRVMGRLTCLLVSAKQSRLLVKMLSAERPQYGWLPEPPQDHYTFAGEMPWHPEFARRTDERELASQYLGVVEGEDGDRVDVEILAHRYSWEGYHSELNDAGDVLVPSRVFSEAVGLRGAPAPFDQVLPDGSLGARVLAAPTGLSGHILYLREDLLRRYAGPRRLVWCAWGERQIYPFPDDWPKWLSAARDSGDDMWRVVKAVSGPRQQARPRHPKK